MINYKMNSLFFKGRQLLITAILSLLFLSGNAQAVKKYGPSDVYAGVSYSNKIVDKLLADMNVKSPNIPKSREKKAKPMHVYELHIAALTELYFYCISKKRAPPPLPTSTPIKYSPTDVYYLTQLLMAHLELVYQDKGKQVNFALEQFNKKTPSDVYQKVFELYYKLNLLNGKSKVSPSEVYSHIYRAKEDLQYSLLVLSQRLDKKEKKKKRGMFSAIYGMNPDGTVMAEFQDGKSPSDVLNLAMQVRDKLNLLRQNNDMGTIERPKISQYDKIKPIDVFLQTQFIIAELNLLKMPMGISSNTNSAKQVSGKSPSDVYHEMVHISYMIDRIIEYQ